VANFAIGICARSKDKIVSRDKNKGGEIFSHTIQQLGMKAVGNGRENIVTIPVPVFFERERERDGKSRTGIRIRYYGISGTVYFDWEQSDYDRESETQSGNMDKYNSTS
jgi:hypothetical protein